MNESNIFGLSARAIMAFIIVVSCCGLAIWLKDIGILKDLALIVIGYYYGQKSTEQTKQGGNGNA